MILSSSSNFFSFTFYSSIWCRTVSACGGVTIGTLTVMHIVLHRIPPCLFFPLDSSLFFHKTFGFKSDFPLLIHSINKIYSAFHI